MSQQLRRLCVLSLISETLADRWTLLCILGACVSCLSVGLSCVCFFSFALILFFLAFFPPYCKIKCNKSPFYSFDEETQKVNQSSSKACSKKMFLIIFKHESSYLSGHKNHIFLGCLIFIQINSHSNHKRFHLPILVTPL